MPRTIVVIPAHNERKKIHSLVKKIREMEYPVLVVDDCSSDDTYELAESAGAVVLRHPINMGYGVALQTGYKYALSHGYDYVAQLDGDGQHEPRYIPDVLKPVIDREADFCIGSRFLGLGDYRPSCLRKIGIMFFRTIIKILTGKYVSDPTSGFQAMNRKVFAYLSMDSFPDDYPDADVIYMLLSAGACMKEVPVEMGYNNERSMHEKLTSNIYYVIKINLLLLTYSLKRIRKIQGVRDD